MQSTPSTFNDCIARLKIEFDRYYSTVMVTLGLRYYLGRANSATRFASAEAVFHSPSKVEVNPDAALQCRDDKYGVTCEIKTSVSLSDQQLVKELESLKKYCQSLVGWDTPNKTVSNHDVALLCYAEDADRLVNRFLECTANGSLSFEKNIIIWEWMVISGMKYGEEDMLIIRHKHGDSMCIDLNKMLKENMKCKIDALMVDYERCKFTRKEPPIQYVMSQLWTDIFPSMTSPGESFQTNAEEILEIASDYYFSWSNIKGEMSQIRKRWINKAMESFCKIGLAQRKKESSSEFEVFYGKKVPKDIKEYIIERLCVLLSGVSPFLEGEPTPKTLKDYL